MLLPNLFVKKEAKKPAPPRIKEINGVEFKYIKNKSAKYIKIAVNSRYSVHITLPYGCPYKVAEDFVKSKMEWIKEKLECNASSLISEDFQTKTGNLIISSGFTEKAVVKKTGNIIQFIYPIGSDFYSKEIQDAAKTAVKKALYIEAKNYLPKRLGELAQQFGFKYNKVALKTHKTRWGSCSCTNNINLNINLMNLDKNLIDYVLIHELCHTVEKNHQEPFWRLVENCLPNAKSIRKKLKSKKTVI